MVNLIYTALDLEMNQPSGKIIQIGLCVGTINNGEILEKRSWIIDPKEPINPRIEKLTGLSDKLVRECGQSLEEAYEDIEGIYKEHSPFMNPLTWGGGDSQTLRKQLGLSKDDRFVFGRRWIDVKTVYQAYQLAQGVKFQSGLSKSMNRLGLQFEGRKHDAMWDAINTFRLYCELLRRIRHDRTA